MSPRRLTSLLVIWFALFSIAAPAITCAAAASQSDCCPTEATPPCHECPQPATGVDLSTLQCVAAPGVSVQSVAVPEARPVLAHPDVDPVLPARVVPQGTPRVVRVFDPEHRGLADFQTRTYLLTGRLRL